MSPASNQEEFEKDGRSTQFYDMVIYTGLPLLYRDVTNSAFANVALAICGGSGTLHEVAGSYDLGDVVGLWKDTKGAADGAKKAFDEIFEVKDTGLVYYVESAPRELVKRGLVEYEVQQKKKRKDLVSMINVYTHKSKSNGKEVFVNVRHAGRPATDYRRYAKKGLHNVQVNLIDGANYKVIKDQLAGIANNIFGGLELIEPRPEEKGFWFRTPFRSLQHVFELTENIRSCYKDDVLYHRTNPLDM